MDPGSKTLSSQFLYLFIMTAHEHMQKEWTNKNSESEPCAKSKFYQNLEKVGERLFQKLPHILSPN